MAKAKQKSYKLREKFIKAFVEELIRKSYDPVKAARAEMFRKKLEEELGKDIPVIEEQPETNLGQPSMLDSLPELPKRSVPQQKFSLPQQRPLPKPIQTPNIMPQPKVTPTKETINLGKLTKILMDPSVLSVESPGENKNVLVNRSGAIQATGMVLSREEIDSILNEVSDKTRIPVGPGVFKAAFQDLLITAVISEHVGTRFLIQKRVPFKTY